MIVSRFTGGSPTSDHVTVLYILSSYILVIDVSVRLWSQPHGSRMLFNCPNRKALLMSKRQTCFWNNEILTPIQKQGMLGPGKLAFKKLKILLDRMMLRRTKV